MKRLALLLLALACAACDTGYVEPPDSPAAPALIPLAVGNEWIMAYERRFAETDEVRETRTDTLRIVRDTLIAGERWFVVETTGRSGELPMPRFIAQREDGIWGWHDPSDSSSMPYLRYLYPADSGDLFAYTPGLCHAEGTLTEIGAPIETPAGSFQAHRFEIAFDSTSVPGRGMLPVAGTPAQDEYVVPGLGPVQLESFYLTGTPDGEGMRPIYRMRWLLVSHTLTASGPSEG